MMDWDKLRIFHAVAEAGSFTHAGMVLDLSQSAVSRQISTLEENINVPLFHRHARGLILTEQGEVLHKTVKEVFSRLSMVEAMITEGKAKPKGALKITTTFAFGVDWLSPKINEFVKSYPEIQLSLLIDDRELNLAMREADAAIRFIQPRQPELICRHLCTMRLRVYASNSYLQEHPQPLNITDLSSHYLVCYPPQSVLPFNSANWLYEQVEKQNLLQTGRMVMINNIHAIAKAVESGMGLALLPEFMAAQLRNISPVLADVATPAVDVNFVYSEELRHSKRISVFRDFLISKLQESGI
ncbi:MAG: LysR family transcriptional regulator [Alphaproteobacteria bacterium]